MNKRYFQVIFIQKEPNYQQNNRFIRIYISSFTFAYIVAFASTFIVTPNTSSMVITTLYGIFFITELLLAMPMSFGCLAIYSRFSILNFNLR